MAVVYAGVAFIVIQIIDGAFDYLKIPEWVGSLIIIMLAVGFPIAVGMAWAFDLTAEGLVRAKVKREPTAAKAPHHVIIGNKTLAVIALLAIAAAVWSWWGRPGPEAALGAKSIAVLPFINISRTEEDEIFSDGITDDILTHLCKIGDLNVIARTSSMQYKGTDKRPREIGQELGVATILEGSVRRYGNKVRIVAQLVEARTGKHLWADDYDRDLTDIFAIQSDVAQQIARALKATLTPAEKGYIEQKPTDNLEAYEYYLKGNALYEQARQQQSNELYENAIFIYEKAVELDPAFAMAYARLTFVHLTLYGQGRDPTEERLAKAKSALDRALALDPDHPEVHWAHGYYYYWGFRDYAPAQEQFTLGLQKQPNNSDLLWAFGLALRNQGQWETGLANIRKAAELDPRYYSKSANVGWTCLPMRNWAEAVRYFDRCIFISSGTARSYFGKAAVYLRSNGDIEKARGVMADALEKVDPSPLAGMRSYIEILARDYQKAMDIVEADRPDYFLRKADIYRYLGQPGSSRAYYDSARVTYEEQVRNNPDAWAAHGYLGIAYAGLGRREEAIREGKLAVEILPLSRNAKIGPDRILDLAKIYTMLGEQDAAIDQLEVLLSIPSEITVPLLKLDLQWDPLREHPRFKALLEKYGER